jgi:hypothetical protein
MATNTAAGVHTSSEVPRPRQIQAASLMTSAPSIIVSAMFTARTVPAITSLVSGIHPAQPASPTGRSGHSPTESPTATAHWSAAASPTPGYSTWSGSWTPIIGVSSSSFSAGMRGGLVRGVTGTSNAAGGCSSRRGRPGRRRRGGTQCWHGSASGAAGGGAGCAAGAVLLARGGGGAVGHRGPRGLPALPPKARPSCHLPEMGLTDVHAAQCNLGFRPRGGSPTRQPGNHTAAAPR